MIAERAKTAAAAIAGMLLKDPLNALKYISNPALDEILDYDTPGATGVVFKVAKKLLETRQVIYEHEILEEVVNAGINIDEVQTLMSLSPPLLYIQHFVDDILDHIIRRDAVKQIQDPDVAIDVTIQQIEERLKADSSRKTTITTTSLAQLPQPQPEEENPAALFKNGYLRKGGAMMLVATSGVGKSVFSIQACLHWAASLPAFGITPVKPLKIAIFQTEDDVEELYDFRENIITGMVTAGISHKDEATKAAENVIIVDCVGAVGDEFVTRLDHFLAQNADIDLVVVNPLQGVFGGDLSKNSELSTFLRAGIDPVIKPAKAGMLVIHHTNKPPSSKDRNGWGSDAFAAYVGAGGAELTNWVRAALSLMPCNHAPGVFRLTAAKRGQKLGWRDDADLPVLHRFIAHSDGHIYWREATYEEGEPPEKKHDKPARQINWQTLFGDQQMTYMELISAVKYSADLGTNRAKEVIKEAVIANILTSTKEGRATLYEVKNDTV